MPSPVVFIKLPRCCSTNCGLQVYIAKARSDRDTDDAFAALAREQAGALLVTADPLFIGRRPQIISLANRYAVATIYDRRDYPADGGLMSYGASIVDQYYQSGRYVGRILKGERPADLPVIQPTKFELVINATTAKSLGIKIPDNLLALTDEVIE
jgi:putative ABC transport system substrate-binding protein